MSQRPQYVCDGCEKPIGNKPHLSLIFNPTQDCGVALPPGTKPGVPKAWTVVRHIQHNEHFKHFHNGKCIGAWADTQIRKAVEKQKQPKQP